MSSSSATMNLRAEDEVASSLLFMAALQQHAVEESTDVVTDSSSDDDSAPTSDSESDLDGAPTDDSDEDGAPSTSLSSSKKRSLFSTWRSKCRVKDDSPTSPSGLPSSNSVSDNSVAVSEVCQVKTTKKKRKTTSSPASSATEYVPEDYQHEKACIITWRQQRRLINPQMSSPFVTTQVQDTLMQSIRLQAQAQAKAHRSTALSREALRTLRNQQARQLQAAAQQASEFSALSRQALQRFRLEQQGQASRQPPMAFYNGKFVRSASTGRVSVCSSSDEGSTSNDERSTTSSLSNSSPIPSELVVKNSSTVMISSPAKSPSNGSSNISRKFSRYNLFYRLERLLLLHQRGATTNPTAEDDVQSITSNSTPSSNDDEAKKNKFYQALGLPPLPSRYEHVPIPKFWFLSSKGSDKKRSHRKSHGVASFTEIAQIVASNWKVCDEETMEFVTEVSNKLKEVYAVYETAASRPSSTVSEDGLSVASSSNLSYCVSINEETPSTPSKNANTKRQRTCSAPGCTNWRVKGGVCIKHGAKKTCHYAGCTKHIVRGGVCVQHGARVVRKYCNFGEGCSNVVVRGGVCVKHGANRKMYSPMRCGRVQSAEEEDKCPTMALTDNDHSLFQNAMRQVKRRRVC